ATISSGLYRFLAIAVLLDVKDIPQVGPLQWGWIRGVALLTPPGLNGLPSRVENTVLSRLVKDNMGVPDGARLQPASGARPSTHISTLIAAGVDPVTIQRRVGHASPSITLNIYGHLIHGADDKAAKVMETAFG